MPYKSRACLNCLIKGQKIKVYINQQLMWSDCPRVVHPGVAYRLSGYIKKFVYKCCFPSFAVVLCVNGKLNMAGIGVSAAFSTATCRRRC